MAAFIAQNIAPIMFLALVVFLLLGYPVAFSLGAVGLLFFVVGVELSPFAEVNYRACTHAGRPEDTCKLLRISLDWPLLQSLPERIYGVMSNDTLLAIPFFTFMGLILERSGMAEDLLDTVGQLFGTIRGGLAYAVVFVGALLAATTGVVAASVISMGLISLPIMLRYGYDRRLASGVIAASGTLAQIIPPSLVLIVMADQLGKSVGDMYEGAFIPGLVLAVLYAVWIFIASILFPSAAPGLPPEAIGFKEQPVEGGTLVNRVTATVLLAVFLGLLVYGARELWAVSTATEAASTGDAAGGLDIIGVLYRIYLATLCVLGGWVASRMIATIRSGHDPRGLVSLLLLAVAAATAGALVMRGSTYKGADFVILTMAVAILFAFAVAVVNWLVSVTTGWRFLSRMAEQVTFVMVPPLLLIFLVLGTIFIGVATPTEGGAMGALGAMLLAGAKRYIDKDSRRFNFEIVRSATEATAKLSAFVVFILVGARIFSLTFYGVNGHEWVEHLLTSLPGGQIGFLVFVNVFVFLLAFFLDFFELAFIVIPLLGPAAAKVGCSAAQISQGLGGGNGCGIDLIWFGVMLGVNMQTSFMHPPFGFALFYLRSVAPKEPYTDKVTGKTMEPVATSQIYWGAIPFVIIQCIMVGLVMAFPQMVMHYKGVPAPAGSIEIQVPQFGGGAGGMSLPGGSPFGAPPSFDAPK